MTIGLTMNPDNHRQNQIDSRLRQVRGEHVQVETVFAADQELGLWTDDVDLGKRKKTSRS